MSRTGSTSWWADLDPLEPHIESFPLTAGASFTRLLQRIRPYEYTMSNAANGPLAEKTYFKQQRDILIGDIATVRLDHSIHMHTAGTPRS